MSASRRCGDDGREGSGDGCGLLFGLLKEGRRAPDGSSHDRGR
jgi:hypothetical protein